MFFLGVLYLQEVLGYDALETGLAFLPTTILIALLSLRYAEVLITRFGGRTALVPGLALIAAGLALFARVPVDGTYLEHVLPSSVLLGVGIGICFPALMALAMSGATRADAGLASGLVNTTAQVGAGVGLAVLATLSATRTEGLLEDGAGRLSALTDGYQLGFMVAAGLVVAAVVAALVVLQPEREAMAEAEPAGAGPAPAYSEAG
jgi:MFS family permease